MTSYIVTVDSSLELISDPESEKARVQNLILNMISGLEYKYLSQEEKELLKRNGYKNEPETNP